jgi:hypothetical protein
VRRVQTEREREEQTNERGAEQQRRGTHGLRSVATFRVRTKSPLGPTAKPEFIGISG